MTTPQSALELAKHGDPAAIAQLINQALQPRNISARVTRQDTCLRIMLEAEQVPDQQALVSYFQQNLAKLKIAAITTVELYGKQTCAMAPGWRQTITLESPPGSAITPIPTVTVTPARQAITDAPRPTTAIAPAAAKRFLPANAKTQKIYQGVLSGVAALVLILIGANIRSVSTLFATKPQSSTKAVVIDNLKSGTYRATIINRLRGVPVIMVTFNGSQPFPMIVDTGAAGTLITRSMAASLGVVPEGQVIAQTANGYTSLDVGYVNSIEVDGAKMNRVPVAIGLPDMDYGLLGHDFFGQFDVTVRENIVEFRTRDE